MSQTISLAAMSAIPFTVMTAEVHAGLAQKRYFAKDPLAVVCSYAAS